MKNHEEVSLYCYLCEPARCYVVIGSLSGQHGGILPTWDRLRCVMEIFFFRYGKSFIDQVCSFKMAGPCFFYSALLAPTPSMNTQKKTTWLIYGHLDPITSKSCEMFVK